MNPSRTYAAVTCSLLIAIMVAGCATASENVEDADLPAGWEHAQRMEGLVQLPCSGSALGQEILSQISVETNADGLAFEYDQAHFRCEQDVEAFMRSERARVDVLIQPIDMSPAAPVRCDCLYDISLEVPLERGDYAFTLYRRWDNVNVPNDPVEVGHADISVR